MKILKRLIAVVMVMSMALSMAACSDTSWVYDYNSKKVQSGLYIALTMDAYVRAGQQEGLDEAQPDLLKQTIDSKTGKQWIIDEAKKASDNYIAVENKFEELGLSFSEKDINEVSQTLKNAWVPYEEIYLKNGVNEKSYKLLIENSKKKELIFNKYYGTDGIEAVSDDNLLVHFKDNFVSIVMFGLPIIQPLEDKLSDDDKKANDELKATADEYAAMFNKGEKTMNELSDMYMHKSEETEHDKDNEEDVIGKDEDSKRIVHKDSTSYSEKIMKALFDEVKADEKAHVIADEKAYYIVVRYDVTKDKTKFEEMKETILVDIKGEEYEKMIGEWGAALEANVNTAAVNRYNPKNIKTK